MKNPYAQRWKNFRRRRPNQLRFKVGQASACLLLPMKIRGDLRDALKKFYGGANQNQTG
jgi:hypothetical protein